MTRRAARNHRGLRGAGPDGVSILPVDVAVIVGPMAVTQPAAVELVHRGLWHSVATGAVADEHTREILGLPPGA